MATIRDVAQKARVSKATVSYVLNGRQGSMRITEATSRRVLQCARELGYYPNAVARALAFKRTDTIAIVMQYPTLFSGWTGFTNELMHGATDAAIQLGYDVLLHTREPAPLWDAERSPVEAEVARLTDGRVDGALLLRDLKDPLPGALRDAGFPSVLMYSHSDDPDAWFIDCDNVLGARLAMEHLIGLGHRRIVYLSGTSRSGAALRRLEGYEAALRDAGLPIRPEWIVDITKISPDFAAVGDLFDGPPDVRPTAIFAWSDDAAVLAMSMLRVRGLRIPEDVAVVGFDSTAMCDHTDPPLTSVRQPVYDMASRALRMLVQQIRGEDVEEQRVLVAPALTVRRSCGAYLTSRRSD